MKDIICFPTPKTVSFHGLFFKSCLGNGVIAGRKTYYFSKHTHNTDLCGGFARNLHHIYAGLRYYESENGLSDAQKTGITEIRNHIEYSLNGYPDGRAEGRRTNPGSLDRELFSRTTNLDNMRKPEEGVDVLIAERQKMISSLRSDLDFH